jgi:hypothetical protein
MRASKDKLSNLEVKPFCLSVSGVYRNYKRLRLTELI